MSTGMLGGLVTLGSVARTHEVPETTARRYADRLKLVAARLGPGYRLIREADVPRLLEAINHRTRRHAHKETPTGGETGEGHDSLPDAPTSGRRREHKAVGGPRVHLHSAS